MGFNNVFGRMGEVDVDAKRGCKTKARDMAVDLVSISYSLRDIRDRKYSIPTHYLMPWLQMFESVYYAMRCVHRTIATKLSRLFHLSRRSSTPDGIMQMKPQRIRTPIVTPFYLHTHSVMLSCSPSPVVPDL